jgi:enoyl-CoA hydratase
MVDYAFMKRNTEDFMTLWKSAKPTIAKVHGAAVAGGSDIALCCDLLVMAEDARIGYMPTRVWGCPTTAMWTYRLGPTRAKQLMFTGDVIDGRTAAAWGLANEAVPADELEAAVMKLATRIAGVPASHLAMHKMVVNQVMLTMGLEQSQQMATVFDGITRHNPEGLWFRRYAQENGFKAAVQWRDSGQPIPEGDEARALIREMEARNGGLDQRRDPPAVDSRAGPGKGLAAVRSVRVPLDAGGAAACADGRALRALPPPGQPGAIPGRFCAAGPPLRGEPHGHRLPRSGRQPVSGTG